MLAWFGADVLKVERITGGDVTRSSCATSRTSTPCISRCSTATSAPWRINTKTPEGKEVMEKLIRDADVLVENFAPGAMDRMGLSWEHIHELNPRLIFGSVKGFNDDSPCVGPQGLRERGAVRRRRRLDHRLLGRSADGQRRGPR